MAYINEKIAFVEFCFSVDSFLAEWSEYSPDEEPTQKDYDEWAETLAYDTIKDPDYSPSVSLTTYAIVSSFDYPNYHVSG